MAVGKQHDHPVDADAQAGGGRQAVLQRRDVVFVIEHSFVVAGVLGADLIGKALRLILGVVQFREAVADFPSADKEFKPVGEKRVFVVTARPAARLPPGIG